MKNAVAVIFAGGAGSRFWPLSQKNKPKQYLNFLGDRSLIQDTRRRVASLFADGSYYVCAPEAQAGLIREHLGPKANLILEPQGKNTAACWMLCVHALLQEGRDPSTVVVGLPADHHVQNEKVLVRDLETAMHVAREKKALVTLGITPTHAHTGYGYIEVGEIPVEGKASRAKRFLEKPNRDLAEQFVREKRYFWNSGIFVWDLDSLREAFQTHCGEAWDRISQASPQTLAEVYHGLPPVPFDIAIAEKTKDLWMLPLNAGWSDVGSWGALSELLESKRDATGTIAWEGEIFSVKSENCLVKVPGKKVALVGVENLVVIEDGDKLLILNKEADQHVREIADHEAKIEKSREGQ